MKLMDDDSEETVAEYQYDAANRRIIKKLYVSNILNQTRHIYLSSSNQVLEERLDTSEDAALQNIWGLMYIDGLILRDRDTNGNGTLDERRYCLQDANWNTVALTDEDGTVTQRFAYQPFGTCEFLGADYDAGTDALGWTTLFTGRELDPESDLYYFRARYLSSTTGTFLCRDYLQYVDGMSFYSVYFVPHFVDPLGMYTIVDGATIACRKFCNRHPEQWPSKCMNDCLPKVDNNTAYQYWYNLEINDTSWQEELPQCPCSISISCNYWGGQSAKLDSQYAQEFNAPSPLAPGNKYHPDAAYETRQKSDVGGPGQQCTYDKSGNLIDSGISAGTADRYGGVWYNVLSHVQHDVTPFEHAMFLCETDKAENTKPLEQCIYMKQYFKVRPIPSASHCSP